MSISQHRSRGFYLVEVMLTVVVLTVGLLSLTALHIHNKQTNLIALQRSYASQLMHDLLERMRSNSSALEVYINDGTRTLSGGSMSEPGQMCTIAEQCDADQLAAFDLWEWERKLTGQITTIDGSSASVLLEPTACLSGPADGSAGTYTLAIAWRSTKAIGNPADSEPTKSNATAAGCASALGDMRHLYWVQNYLVGA